jgi:hypothetical protein
VKNDARLAAQPMIFAAETKETRESRYFTGIRLS